MRSSLSNSFLLSVLFTLTNAASAQTLSDDGWARIAVDSASQWSFHTKSIKFDAVPPSVVSVNIRRQIDKNHLPYEFRCREQRARINGVPVSLASETDTIRRIFYDGFCGIEYEGGFWVLVGSTFPKGEPLKMSHYVFADIRSTQIIEIPFAGRATRLLRMGYDKSRSPKFIPAMGDEIAVDCGNPMRYAYRGPSAADFKVYESAVNTLPHAWSFLFCASGWPVSTVVSHGRGQTKSVPSPDKGNISSFQDVLRYCEESGHKKGTEKFGECVTGLSR